MYAVIDAGGTTFKCAVSGVDGDLVFKRRVKTRHPDETIRECLDFFRSSEQQTGAKIIGMGIACFGPLNIDDRSENFGKILNTPKPDWANFRIRERFEQELGVNVNIDTDVNAALKAEMKLGAGRGARRAAYVTVGTGIGVSFIQDDVFIAKPTHSEFGHICVERHPEDLFEGRCAFHKSCLEGLASAAAFEARWGDAKLVDQNSRAWEIEADYLAQLCISINLLLRPEKIILGGGMLLAPTLIDKIRAAYLSRINGYLLESAQDIESKIVCPWFGDDAGLAGAKILAEESIFMPQRESF
jgi:fructokinase